MRASSVVAILCLAAEVALSVALPLPALKFERRGGGRGRGHERWNHKLPQDFRPADQTGTAEPDRPPPTWWRVKFQDPQWRVNFQDPYQYQHPSASASTPAEGPPQHHPQNSHSIPPDSPPPGGLPHEHPSEGPKRKRPQQVPTPIQRPGKGLPGPPLQPQTTTPSIQQPDLHPPGSLEPQAIKLPNAPQSPPGSDPLPQTINPALLQLKLHSQPQTTTPPLPQTINPALLQLKLHSQPQTTTPPLPQTINPALLQLNSQPQTTTASIKQTQPWPRYSRSSSASESPPPSPPLFVGRSLGTSPPAPVTPNRRPYSHSPTPPMSPYTPASAPRSPPDSSPPSTPESPHAPTTPSIVESSVIVEPLERELLEHVVQRIELAARAYVRELLTASMDDLD